MLKITRPPPLSAGLMVMRGLAERWSRDKISWGLMLLGILYDVLSGERNWFEIWVRSLSTDVSVGESLGVSEKERGGGCQIYPESDI